MNRDFLLLSKPYQFISSNFLSFRKKRLEVLKRANCRSMKKLMKILVLVLLIAVSDALPTGDGDIRLKID